jgi:L-ribulose-5-phosphate 3-epimerase
MSDSSAGVTQAWGAVWMKIAFVTANYVARASRYALSPFRWDEAERVTVEQFSRHEWHAILDEIAGLGIRSVEVWRAHANPDSLSEEDARALQDALTSRGMRGVSYAAGLWGAATNPAGAEATFRAARALQLPIIAGGMDAASVPVAAALAHRYGVKVAIENHTEQTPDEVLQKIAVDPTVIGATVDTGWWATQGYSAAAAIRTLAPHLWHVHLKDVRAAGAHDTCALGEGVTDIPAVLDALRDIGYGGYCSIEHEPEDHEPMAEVRESLRYLEGLGVTF